MSAIAYAAPTGPFPIGVRDGEMLDTTYPSMRAEDAKGRRLMVRVWYPASSFGGEHRPYLVGEEAQLVQWCTEANGAPTEWTGLLSQVMTHSVESAEAAAGPFPTLVFSHGATSWVSQNTPLMEHLASYGYIVWSVAHPGEASGVRYPDGSMVRYEDIFQDTFVGLVADPTYMDKLTGDVARRLEVTPNFLDENAVGPWAQRWVDDMRATIDAIESQSIEGPAGELASESDIDTLGVLGMSFGAAAAASTAQQDQRVKGVVNLDGGQFLSDLFDTDIRIPLLHLATDMRRQLEAMGIADIRTIDANEFFFEPLSTAGAREDVVRLCVKDITHLELSDFVLLPTQERARVLPAGGKVEPQRAIDLINAFVRAYFDAVLLKQDSGFPGTQLQQFPEARPINLTPNLKDAPTEELNR